MRARCRRLLRDDQAAEDATQETFVRVLRHAVTAPSDAEARRWLYRIATNICLNELRNAKTAARFSADPDTPQPVRASASEERLESRDFVRRLLLHLPERVRLISLLRHVDGMHHDEVACQLGLSRRTVAYELARFRDDVQRTVAEM